MRLEGSQTLNLWPLQARTRSNIDEQGHCACRCRRKDDAAGVRPDTLLQANLRVDDSGLRVGVDRKAEHQDVVVLFELMQPTQHLIEWLPLNRHVDDAASGLKL